jgi:hypothetical protein
VSTYGLALKEPWLRIFAKDHDKPALPCAEIRDAGELELDVVWISPKETPRIKKVDLGNVNNDIRHCFAALAMTMELTQQLLGIAKVVSAKQSTRLERGASDLLQPRSCTHLVTGQATSKGSGTV